MDIEETILKLTIDQKVDLISGVDFWHTKAIPDLGIPSLRMSDGPNGVRGSRLFNGIPAACFPCGTAMAATWDTDLIQSGGELMGQEAIAKGASILLGPTVNMLRSPLGGRGFESFGEDPMLAGKMAAAVVNGVQLTGVIATIKHFVGNDQEDYRQGSNSVISARALREVYLLPFQIAEKDAHPQAYMTSYNKVNGLHASESAELIQGILRGEWRFDGLVFSDWYGTFSVAEAINAGLDLEMPGPSRWRGLLAKLSVSCNKVSEHVLDDRVRAILKTINRVAPLKIPENAPERTIDTPTTAEKLRQIASAGIVLLKNEDNILPLTKETTIAVIGPNAAVAAFSGGGSARLRPYYAVTPLRGIQAQSSHVSYAMGATNYKRLPALSSLTKAPDGTRGMEMRIYLDPPSTKDRTPIETFNVADSDFWLSDYKHSAVKTNLFYAEVEGILVPDIDSEYLFSLTVNGTARLYVDGEQVVDNETTQRPGESFFGSGTAEEIGTTRLSKGQRYTVLVEFGTAPTSTLRRAGVTQMGLGGFYVGGCPESNPATLLSDAVELAKTVDRVIICVGLNHEWESEGWDRKTMDLPPGSDALIEATVAANPKVIVVNQSGTPVSMPWADSVPAIVQAWYGGNETGNAIADVLFGRVNASGKLPFSWPVDVSDNPAFINTLVDAGQVLYGEGIYVGHRWYEKTARAVLFPFGHGLSYTTFQFSNLVIESDDLAHEGPATTTLSISVDVLNTGVRDGEEVVQVYIAHSTASVPRPLKELKGFTKAQLAKGETKTVRVEIDLRYACSYWDERTKSWTAEKGAYRVLVGNSSANVLAVGEFEIARTMSWTGL